MTGDLSDMDGVLPPALQEALEDNKLFAQRLTQFRCLLPGISGPLGSLLTLMVSTWDEYSSHQDAGCTTTAESDRMRGLMDASIVLGMWLTEGQAA